MGADLYIESLYRENADKWEGEFDAALAERDKAPIGSAEYTAAQKRAEKAYHAMFSVGYFRDPYNNWDVLWRFGLLWWEDVLPNVDATGCLPVREAERLLAELLTRQEQFEASLTSLPSRDAAYFRRQAKALNEFLETAIRLQEPIRASL